MDNRKLAQVGSLAMTMACMKADGKDVATMLVKNLEANELTELAIDATRLAILCRDLSRSDLKKMRAVLGSNHAT